MNHPLPTVAVPDEGAEIDRRDTPRLRAVCRIAKIVRVDDAGLWMVRNISDGGMMLTTSVPVTMGENITVILAEKLTLHGHVIWVGDGQCGIAFADEIDGEAILRQLAEDKAARRYRPFRIALKAGALASFNHKMQPIALVNLSQHGAGIVHDGSVTTGMRLDLLLSGGIRREAIVRWSREDRAGLWLTQPLERALLESIRSLHAEPEEHVAPPKATKAKRQKSCANRP
jgi:PilZ domain